MTQYEMFQKRAAAGVDDGMYFWALLQILTLRKALETIRHYAKTEQFRYIYNEADFALKEENMEIADFEFDEPK